MLIYFVNILQHFSQPFSLIYQVIITLLLSKTDYQLTGI